MYTCHMALLYTFHIHCHVSYVLSTSRHSFHSSLLHLKNKSYGLLSVNSYIFDILVLTYHDMTCHMTSLYVTRYYNLVSNSFYVYIWHSCHMYLVNTWQIWYHVSCTYQHLTSGIHCHMSSKLWQPCQPFSFVNICK